MSILGLCLVFVFTSSVLESNEPFSIKPIPELKSQVLDNGLRDLRLLAVSEEEIEALVGRQRAVFIIGEKLRIIAGIDDQNLVSEVKSGIPLSGVVQIARAEFENSALAKISELVLIHFQFERVATYDFVRLQGMDNMKVLAGDVLVLYGSH